MSCKPLIAQIVLWMFNFGQNCTSYWNWVINLLMPGLQLSLF